MWWKTVCAVGGFTALLGFIPGVASAGAAGLGLPPASIDPGTTILKTHSVGAAQAKLHRHGYHDVDIERSTLPYSFRACKRGIRYHIHVNYYGDFTQVDAVGPCGRERYEEGDGRDRYYDRYPLRRGYW